MIITCPVCSHQSDRDPQSDCPFCGTGPGTPVPVQPPGPRIVTGKITDPLAMFLWELEKHLPNGTIQAVILNSTAILKQRDGVYQPIPDEVALAEHCNTLARTIRGKEKKP